MADFNGRIEAIIRAFKKYPAGDINTRMIVREALAAERAEGFKEGYNEGTHDQYQAQRDELERAERGLTRDASEAETMPVMSRCECGGLARHQHGCRWRQGYGSVVIAPSGETAATAGED